MAKPKKTKAHPKSMRSWKRAVGKKIGPWGKAESAWYIVNTTDERDERRKRKKTTDPLKKKKPGSVAKKAAVKRGKAAKAARTQASPTSMRSAKKAARGPVHWTARGTPDFHTGKTLSRMWDWALPGDKLAKKKPGSVAKRIGEYPRKTGLEKPGGSMALRSDKRFAKTAFKKAGPKVRTFVQKTILGVPVPFTTKEITKGFKRTKLFKPTTLKGMAKGLAKAVKATSGGVSGAADLAWAMGSSMAARHERSGRTTALQKVRARTRASAKAGKPRYGSFDAALKADRNKR